MSDTNKRIIDLEAKQTLGSGDYLAADSEQGTYKVDANTNIMTPLTNVRNNVANSSASPDKYSTSTAYKVGDMVIQNDILYKCTTACSAASWAVNSACFTATTLASVVTQLNSDLDGVVEVNEGTITKVLDNGYGEINSTYTKLYKVGGVGIFNFSITMSARANDWVAIGSVDIKPKSTVFATIPTHEQNVPLRAQIRTNGNIEVYQGYANKSYFGQMVYPIA